MQTTRVAMQSKLEPVVDWWPEGAVMLQEAARLAVAGVEAIAVVRWSDRAVVLVLQEVARLVGAEAVAVWWPERAVVLQEVA